MSLPGIDEALVAHLKSLPDVAALAGGAIGGRGDEGSPTPGVCIWQYSEVPYRTHGGAVDLADFGVQIDCKAETQVAASKLAKLIRRKLDCFAGRLGGLRVDYLEASLIAPSSAPAAKAGSEKYTWIASLDLEGLCEIDPSEVHD